mmetsp:Transcript_14316/g.48490  ORF Transcript_14316/g.48490 Transcript_14316/m.48490 type:complete len:258 (+) Transcript_14316:718-1491(+)
MLSVGLDPPKDKGEVAAGRIPPRVLKVDHCRGHTRVTQVAEGAQGVLFELAVHVSEGAAIAHEAGPALEEEVLRKQVSVDHRLQWVAGHPRVHRACGAVQTAHAEAVELRAGHVHAVEAIDHPAASRLPWLPLCPPVRGMQAAEKLEDREGLVAGHVHPSAQAPTVDPRDEHIDPVRVVDVADEAGNAQAVGLVCELRCVLLVEGDLVHEGGANGTCLILEGWLGGVEIVRARAFQDAIVVDRIGAAESFPRVLTIA